MNRRDFFKIALLALGYAIAPKEEGNNMISEISKKIANGNPLSPQEKAEWGMFFRQIENLNATVGGWVGVDGQPNFRHVNTNTISVKNNPLNPSIFTSSNTVVVTSGNHIRIPFDTKTQLGEDFGLDATNNRIYFRDRNNNRNFLFSLYGSFQATLAGVLYLRRNTYDESGSLLSTSYIDHKYMGGYVLYSFNWADGKKMLLGADGVHSFDFELYHVEGSSKTANAPRICIFEL